LDLGTSTVSGKYWLWLTGGPLTLTGGPSDYTVNMGSSTLWLEVKLGPGGNGALGDLKATVALTDLFGAVGSTPQFVGSFIDTAATVDFHGLFPTSTALPGEADFTVKLPRKGLAPWKLGAAVSGYVSSGEFVPAVPEPSSLALMGTGVLGLAAMIRRKLS
jgi:hypothetical protein